MDHWSRYFGLDRRLALSIMEIESRGRWWAVSTNDRAVLTEREWPYQIIDRFKLDATRPEIWASYGVMQVNYLVALDLGFRGTVDELRGTWTNVKYGCRRLWQIREDLVQHGYEFNYSAWLWHWNQSSVFGRDVIRTFRNLESSEVVVMENRNGNTRALNPWNGKDEDVLRRLWPLLYTKISHAEMVKIFNRSFEAIRVKANRMGMKCPEPKSNINIEALKEIEKRINA